MSIELGWEITQMKNRIADEGVFYTEWVCYAFKDGYQKSYNGYSEFTPNTSDQNFIPLNNLTQEQVLEWVWRQVNKEEIESILTAEIQESITPTIDYTLPWLNTE